MKQIPDDKMIWNGHGVAPMTAPSKEIWDLRTNAGTIHGLDAEAELASILQEEILKELQKDPNYKTDLDRFRESIKHLCWNPDCFHTLEQHTQGGCRDYCDCKEFIPRT